jgi:hypothetical protein
MNNLTMSNLTRLFRLLFVSFIVSSSPARAVDPVAASEKDPLRAALMESREKNRGVVLHFSGSTLAMVVTAIDGTYVTGRSQAVTRIVVRLDRIDGVSAAL